jgi:membrane protease YdiL (CAAX protease family)
MLERVFVTPVDRPGLATSPRTLHLALVFALLFPTVMAGVEYLAATPGQGGPNFATLVAYIGGRAVQFSFPLLCLWVFGHRLPRPAAPGRGGLVLGAVFGLVVGVGILVLYHAVLRDTVLFADSPRRLRAKLGEYGLDSPGGFALFAAFVTVLHSFLEEYYWRWFVFGRLRRVAAPGTAMALSSLAFMAFHVFALLTFLPGYFWTAVVPLTACVGVGGAAWAWLYQRTGTLYAPWLSHLLVDAALFVVGYDWFFVR